MRASVFSVVLERERSNCTTPSRREGGSLGQKLRRFGVAQLSHPGRKLSTGFLLLAGVLSGSC